MYSGEGEKDEQERRRGGRLVLVEKCWLASFFGQRGDTRV